MRKLLFIALWCMMTGLLSAQNISRQQSVYRTDFTGHPFLSLSGDSLYLESFAGKFILIDVWSPGCGLCMNEYPRLFEIMKAYKEVQLVALCASPSVKWWKKCIEDRRFQGIQVLESTASAFLKEVGIFGVPRLILLDRKGQVLKAHLPVPSKPEFKVELEKCLKE